jgi:signal transduction histidine kinase
MKSRLIPANATLAPHYLHPDHSNLFIPAAEDNNISLPKSNNDIGLSAATLIHELRNPLTNIKLSIEMLDSLIKDDNVKKILGIITRSSARINDLIDDLLNRKQDEVKAEKYSIHQLIDEVLELTKDRLHLKNVLVMEYYDMDFEVVLNRPQMKMALTNIIVNAIDAMTTGKGELKIVTKTKNGGCVLLIRDNGCGISKENLKNIFKLHYTNKPGGLGIGLAATANILRSNNVRVNVESRETKGTCFILLFDRNE